MAQQAGERTEKATSRRRQRAKAEGQFAYSQELTSAMTLAACAATTFYLLQSPAGFRSFFASLLENAANRSSSESIRQAGTYFLIAAVVWKTLSASWDQIVSLPAYSIDASNAIIRSVTLRVVVYVIGAVVLLAIADFFIQRWRFEQSIKQTKAEVKKDMKALEGNPVVKGKIKSIQRDAARRRMMSHVKDADVIVTNPTHYAVALEYKPEQMPAPRVVAKGRDLIAQKIKELGREHDIPTVENVPLARALYRMVEIEQEIPMDLYKAVAEVLAYVYKIRKQTKR